MKVSSPEIINPGDVELVEWLLKHVLEGDPRASFCVTEQSDDNRTFSGVWECTQGKFLVNYEWDEIFYVLEGRVTLENENGGTIEFKAGDLLHFSEGQSYVWTVDEKVRKVYTLFYPTPQQL